MGRVGSALRLGAVVIGADAAAAAVTRPLHTATLLSRSALASVRLFLRPGADGGVAISTGTDHAALLAVTWRRWALWWIASVLVIAWGVALGRAYDAVYGPIGCLLPLALLPLTATRAAMAAHAHWCLRRGAVGRVGEWMRRPGEWMPPSQGLGGVALLAAAVVLLGGSAGVQAAAALGGPTAPLAAQIIDALIPADGTVTGLTAAVGALTHITAFAGAAALGWSSLVTIVAAAESGRVLVGSGGQVGVWGPIRAAIGLVLLAPLPSGLPVLDQLLVRPGAQAADTMASAAWGAFVGRLTDDKGAPLPGLPPSVGGDVLAEQVLRSASCSGLLAAMSAAEASATTGAATAAANYLSTPAAGGTWVKTGSDRDDSGVQVWSWAPCGAVSVPVPPSTAGTAAKSYSAARIAAVDALVTAVSNGLAATVGLAAMPGGTTTLPGNIVSTLEPMASAYDKAAVSASATMMAAQTTAARAKLRAASADWLSAGAYWRSLAQLQAQAVAMASVAPTWQPPAGPDSARALGASSDTIKAVQTSGDALAAEIVRERGAASVTAADLASIGDGDGDTMLSKLTGPLDKRIAAAVVRAAAPDGTDPMGAISDSGSLLLSAGEAGILAGVPVAMAAGSGPGKLIGADKVFDWLQPKVDKIIYVAIGAGWLQQFLLPATPWLATLWLGVGWIISIVEVMVFGVLWSLLLVNLSGKDFIDHVHRPGLVIGLNFLFRPALGTIGLVASYHVLPLAMTLVSQHFADAYVGQQGGHFVGVAGVLGGILLFDYISWQICTRVLTLVHTIPDRLPAWLGLGASGFGEAESHARSVGGVVATGGGAAQRGPGGGGGSGGGGSGKPSKVPSGGGGEAIGVRPVGGCATGGGEAHWTTGSGGLDSLSDGQRAAATAAYGEWAADNPQAAARHGLDGYVSYAQEREAQRGGRG